MMQAQYLEKLDRLLADGAAHLHPDFLAKHSAFVRSLQNADGGFSGRLGGSDIYYTDFALRTLQLTGEIDTVLPSVSEHLNAYRPAELDVVRCFNILNCARILRAHGPTIDTDDAALWRCISAHRSPNGGYSREQGGPPSSYITFLAMLCCQMLARKPSNKRQTINAMMTLQCADGGFIDQRDVCEGGRRHCPAPQQECGAGQTSTTAAAAAVMEMHGAMTPKISRRIIKFLTALQASDGGFSPAPGIQASDLLSTFTAALTLVHATDLGGVDLPAVARFVKSAADGSGGFRSCSDDEQADIEYTYYGIATTALLRAHVRASSGNLEAAAMTTDNILKVEDISKAYPSPDGTARSVLHGTSFAASPGETLGIVGPSGSGKSTLLHLIGALDKPDTGSIRLGDIDVVSLDGLQLAAYRSSKVGFVFQDHHLLPQLTARENVLLPTLANRQPTKSRDALAQQLLERVGVAHRADAFPAQMSGGERQRVAIARAMINQPRLLLCDEPTGNLDQATADVIAALLLELAQSDGVIVITVTHNLELAGQFQRRLQLHDGRLIDAPGEKK